MTHVKTTNLVKEYAPGARAVDEVSINIRQGEFFALLGPSGCGKSTLLRSLAGLERVSSGHIHIGVRDVTDVDPGQRGIAMVFQDYALFPGMDVADNISYSQRVRRIRKAKRQKTVERFAQGLGLEKFTRRMPSQLSGGQQQRVALARAMAAHPDVLLLDEPLSNLDARLRLEARTLLQQFHQDTQVTTVFVTHDQAEALAIADRIAVMRDGVVQQIGTPTEMYHAPRTQFVAQFIGMYPMNFMSGTVDSNTVRVPAGSLPFPAGVDVEAGVTVGVRPEYLKWRAHLGDTLGVRARVAVVENAGASALLHCHAADGEEGKNQQLLRSIVPVDEAPAVGDEGWLGCHAHHVLVFNSETGSAVTADDARDSAPLPG